MDEIEKGCNRHNTAFIPHSIRLEEAKSPESRTRVLEGRHTDYSVEYCGGGSDICAEGLWRALRC